MIQRDRVYARYLNELFCAVLTLESKAECDLFFRELFTAQELNVFAQRLQVACLLHKGETYQMIHQELAISNGTISRVNTKYCYGSGGYQMVLDRLEKILPPDTDRRQDA